MNSKMTINLQLLTTEPKKIQKQKQTKQKLEQELNHRNGHHREGYQWGEEVVENGRKGTGNK